jgi:hypothetical protein
MLLEYFRIAKCLNRQDAMHVVRAFYAGGPSVASFTKAHYFANGYAQCISSSALCIVRLVLAKRLFIEALFALAECFALVVCSTSGLKCHHIINALWYKSATIGSSLQLSVSAIAKGMASPFKLPHSFLQYYIVFRNNVSNVSDMCMYLFVDLK